MSDDTFDSGDKHIDMVRARVARQDAVKRSRTRSRVSRPSWYLEGKRVAKEKKAAEAAREKALGKLEALRYDQAKATAKTPAGDVFPRPIEVERDPKAEGIRARLSAEMRALPHLGVEWYRRMNASKFLHPAIGGGTLVAYLALDTKLQKAVDADGWSPFGYDMAVALIANGMSIPVRPYRRGERWQRGTSDGSRGITTEPLVSYNAEEPPALGHFMKLEYGTSYTLPQAYRVADADDTEAYARERLDAAGGVPIVPTLSEAPITEEAKDAEVRARVAAAGDATDARAAAAAAVIPSTSPAPEPEPNPEPEVLPLSNNVPYKGMPAAIYIVGCSKEKRDTPQYAGDMYVSPLFKKAKEYIARKMTEGDGWAILSAKHGLMHPRQVIEPYDKRIEELSASERGELTEAVAKQWQGMAGDGSKTSVVLLAGAAYGELLRAAVPGIKMSEPMAGLGVGERLRFLTGEAEPEFKSFKAWKAKIEAKAAGRAAPPPAGAPDPWSSVRLRASTLAAIHAAGQRYGLKLEATILRLLALADAAAGAPAPPPAEKP